MNEKYLHIVLFLLCIDNACYVWLWLNDGLVACECWNGMKVQWLTYLVCSSSLCVVLPPAAHAPVHTHRPSGLQMLHAVLTPTVKLCLCDVTCI